MLSLVNQDHRQVEGLVFMLSFVKQDSRQVESLDFMESLGNQDRRQVEGFAFMVSLVSQDRRQVIYDSKVGEFFVVGRLYRPTMFGPWFVLSIQILSLSLLNKFQ